MKKRLLITRRNEQILSSLFEEQKLIQVNVEDAEKQTMLGNIYVGKVKNIVKNIEAAFVEISQGQMCYLPLNKSRHPIFCGKRGKNGIVIGDEILVQIEKDAVKTKNLTVTTELQLAGKYVILTHGKNFIGISNKIMEEEERKRLRTIVSPFVEKECGMIVRTNAAYVPSEQIEQEVRALYAQYTAICQTGIYKQAFSLVYQAPAGYLADIRNSSQEELEKIITDDTTIYQEIKTFLSTYQQEDLPKLELYEDTMISLSQLYGLETKLERALQKRVWLKSGGYLVIEPTEALTVIDVNTGKAIEGKGQREKHFLKMNVEAGREIAYQLRLRNLSGIILVDFIDMEKAESRRELLCQLEQYLKQDPVKTVLVDMTKLNLVEITRKKTRKPLHEQISFKSGK